MKTFAFAAAAVLAGTAAYAGGPTEPVIEMAPAVVVDDVQDTAGGTSNAGLIIPLILIALIAAAASSSGGDSGRDLTTYQSM